MHTEAIEAREHRRRVTRRIRRAPVRRGVRPEDEYELAIGDFEGNQEKGNERPRARHPR